MPAGSHARFHAGASYGNCLIGRGVPPLGNKAAFRKKILGRRRVMNQGRQVNHPRVTPGDRSILDHLPGEPARRVLQGGDGLLQGGARRRVQQIRIARVGAGPKIGGLPHGQVALPAVRLLGERDEEPPGRQLVGVQRERPSQGKPEEVVVDCVVVPPVGHIRKTGFNRVQGVLNGRLRQDHRSSSWWWWPSRKRAREAQAIAVPGGVSGGIASRPNTP